MPNSQEKIRVLIVDDIAETRENIRRLLQFDNSIEVAGTARNGKEAIEYAQQDKPDVIIMDINMPDMDGITATEAIRRKVPFVQVIILSVQSDPSYMRRAMLAGARDFLAKPPSIDELTAAIHRAGAMAVDEKAKKAQAFPAGSPGNTFTTPQTPSLGKIIVVFSPKGGTGVTTICTNLALALLNEQKRVLLVDGNLQFGDVAVFFNEPIKNSILDLMPRVDELEPEIIQEVVIQHAVSGLKILPAPPRPDMLTDNISEPFSKLLQFLRTIYSYIVVDTTSYLTDIVQVSLDQADIIVLVTTQDIPSLKRASSFLNLADASGIKRDHIFFVMNRFDKRIAITPERVSQNLRQEVMISIPLEERVVTASINKGIPLLIENKTHPISKSIFMMTDMLREKLIKMDAPVSMSSAKK